MVKIPINRNCHLLSLHSSYGPSGPLNTLCGGGSKSWSGSCARSGLRLRISSFQRPLSSSMVSVETRILVLGAQRSTCHPFCWLQTQEFCWSSGPVGSFPSWEGKQRAPSDNNSLSAGLLRPLRLLLTSSDTSNLFSPDGGLGRGRAGPKAPKVCGYPQGPDPHLPSPPPNAP